MQFRSVKAQAEFCWLNESNDDSYGSQIQRFAQRWAELMEPKLQEGEDLEEIVLDCREQAAAEVGGVSGFQLSCAVQILSTLWLWGEEIACWADHLQAGVA